MASLYVFSVLRYHHLTLFHFPVEVWYFILIKDSIVIPPLWFSGSNVTRKTIPKGADTQHSKDNLCGWRIL